MTLCDKHFLIKGAIEWFAMFQTNFDTPGICRCSLCIWVESTQLNFIVSSEKKSKYEIEFNCGGRRLDKKDKKRTTNGLLDYALDFEFG